MCPKISFPSCSTSQLRKTLHFRGYYTFERLSTKKLPSAKRHIESVAFQLKFPFPGHFERYIPRHVCSLSTSGESINPFDVSSIFLKRCLRSTKRERVSPTSPHYLTIKPDLLSFFAKTRDKERITRYAGTRALLTANSYFVERLGEFLRF